MKCSRCNHDSTYPQRTGRVCPQCKGRFAFEPREGDPVTDMLFKNAVEAVSAHGTVHFGVENLYYEVCRRKPRKSMPVGCSFVLFVAALVLAFVGGLNEKQRGGLVVAVVIAAVGLINLAARAKAGYVALSSTQFRDLYDRWCNVHGTPDKVIQRRDKPPPPKAEPDLGDYSFDRAVICDRARTVDLLLANNFHFENNCAILTYDGYPPGPFPMVKEMLKRNPKLQVFVLHDATPDGCRLARRLAQDRSWFPEPVRVIDVGLRPGHAQQFFGLWQQPGKQEVVEGNGLSAAEVKWLQQSQLELAAVRPQQVIRWLFRAINSQSQPEPSETEAVVGDGNGGSVLYFMGDEQKPLARDIEAVEADFDSFG